MRSFPTRTFIEEGKEEEGEVTPPGLQERRGRRRKEKCTQPDFHRGWEGGGMRSFPTLTFREERKKEEGEVSPPGLSERGGRRRKEKFPHPDFQRGGEG